MPHTLKVTLLAVVVAVSAALAAGAAGNGRGGSDTGRLSAAYTVDASRGMPVEGSVSYIVLRRRPGGTVARTELRGNLDTRSISTPVTSGRYRISAYQRLCEGNCEQLAAPSHGCGRDVRVRAGQSVRARILVRWTAANAEDQPNCQIRIAR